MIKRDRVFVFLFSVFSILKMHDADAMLNKITGSSNYLKELERLTGNIEHIDANFMNEKLMIINECDTTIRKIINSTRASIRREFFELSIMSRIGNPYDEVKKKNKNKVKKVLAQELKPKTMIKSPYFKMVKTIEKRCNNLIESYNIDTDKPSITSVQEVLKTNPELMSIKNFFDQPLEIDADCAKIVEMRRAANVIISIYMQPLYDLRGTTEKNWHMIGDLFTTAARDKVDVSEREVKDMLYLFIIAKYRCMITDNDKYYLKLFMSLLNKTTKTQECDGVNDNEINASRLIGEMDAPRFLELLDTINLGKIGDKETVKRFAIQSKEIIKRIVNRKEGETMENIMTDLQNLMSAGHEDVHEDVEAREVHEDVREEVHEDVEDTEDVLKGLI